MQRPPQTFPLSLRAALSALQVSVQGGNDPEAEPATDKEENHDTPIIGVLEFLPVIQKKVDPKEVVEKGLMFVDIMINSQSSKNTMVDSGAIPNFILDQEARRLRIKIEKYSEKMKVVNSKALPIIDVSKRALSYGLGQEKWI